MSMQGANNRYSFFALTSLFFFWGFITCLNDILVPHLRAVFSLSYFQSSLVQAAFFLSYFCSSIPAGAVVGKFGFKRAIVAALLTSALGALLFVPAALLPSYPAFLLALFVLASGITLLQVAANAYVTISGDSETASSRLNFTQAFNSLGTTVAPTIGGVLILTAAGGAQEDVQTVIGPYLFMAAVLVGLAGWFSRLPMKEAWESNTKLDLSGIRQALAFPQLRGGVLGMFVYVGAEVAIGSFLTNYISHTLTLSGGEKAAAMYVSLYWGLALVGRALGAGLLRFIDAGKLLALCSAMAIALVGTTLLTDGYVSVFAILSVGLFNSIMFPTIFSLSVRGLGSVTNIGSSLVIMAIVGGAIVPMMMGLLADSVGLKFSFFLPASCYLIIAGFGWANRERVAALGVRPDFGGQARAVS